MPSGAAVAPANAVVARPIIYPGFDVHKDSITIAALPAGTTTPRRVDRLPNDLPKLKRWLERVARDGEVRACYETSGAGYVPHRALQAWGDACEVIAPSLMPSSPPVGCSDTLDGTLVGYHTLRLAPELIQLAYE